MGASKESLEKSVVSTLTILDESTRVSDKFERESVCFNESAIIFFEREESICLGGTVSETIVNDFGNLVLHLLLASKEYVIKSNRLKKNTAVFIFAYSL
jgi:hypothetical protein